jgi:hypothetical protein
MRLGYPLPSAALTVNKTSLHRIKSGQQHNPLLQAENLQGTGNEVLTASGSAETKDLLHRQKPPF